MSRSKTYTGCIYSKPPHTMQTRMDLTMDEMLEMEREGKLIGLPILMEHHRDVVVGEIVSMWHDPRDNFFVDFFLYTDEEGGRRCQEMIADRTLLGLSLSHEFKSRKPLEVSLCAKGYRHSTWVINASEGYESGDSGVYYSEPPAYSAMSAQSLPQGVVTQPQAPAPAPAQQAAPEVPVINWQQIMSSGAAQPPAQPQQQQQQTLGKRTATDASLDSAQEPAPKKHETPLHSIVANKGQITPKDAEALLEYMTSLEKREKKLREEMEVTKRERVNDISNSIKELMQRAKVDKNIVAQEIERLRQSAEGHADGVEIMSASLRMAQMAYDSLNTHMADATRAEQAASGGDLWAALNQKLNSVQHYNPGASFVAPQTPIINASANRPGHSVAYRECSPDNQGAVLARAMAMEVDRFDRECNVGIMCQRKKDRPASILNWR